MVLKKFVASTNSSASEVNTNFNEAYNLSGKNLIRRNISGAQTMSVSGAFDDWFSDAYTSSGGTNGSVIYSTAYFSTNKYIYKDWSAEPHVIIVASSLTTTDFAINNCVCQKINTNKWVVYCTSGTNNVKIAQIYKTLFYGSNGSDARATATYITGLTGLETSVTNHVGYTAKHIRNSMTISGGGFPVGQGRYDFSNTTDNTYTQAWTYCVATSSNLGYAVRTQAYLPTTTVINEVSSNGAGLQTSDELGTDTSAEVVANPNSLRVKVYFYASSGFTPSGTVNTIIVYKGSLGSLVSESTGTGTCTEERNDTYPTFVASTISEVNIVHTIPTGTFSTTIRSVFLTLLSASWESGADIQYKLTNASNDSGWLSCGVTPQFIKIKAFTLEPTTLTIKLIPKSSSPTAGYPAIYGFALRCT